MAPPSRLVAQRAGGRVRLLLDNKIVNIGLGPVEFHMRRDGNEYSTAATQFVRRSNRRTSVPFSTGARLTWKYVGPAHGGHFWKFKDAARFELWATDPDGRATQRVRVGPKHDYCLRDLFNEQTSSVNQTRYRYGPCSQRRNARHDTLGISVGWADGYPFSYPQNWIDVTGLAGCYAIVETVDPLNHILETDENDNSVVRMVRLPLDPRAPSRHCPAYAGPTA